MPKYDKALLARQARALDFPPYTFEKVARLTEVLRFVNEMPELREALALKGGTAINLTMFPLPRLSVDIDLDFALNLPREEMLARRERVNNLLGRFMAAEGYSERDKSKRSHSLDSTVYAYINAAGNLDNIKVEINYSLRCHVLPTMEAAIGTIAFATFPVRTLAPIEIFSSKIVALASRAAARDLYDLNNMVAFNLFSAAELDLLRRCAVFYLAIAGDAGAQALDFQRLDNITPRKIKTDLYPVIRSTERFDFAAVKQRVGDFLAEHMVLTSQEAEFLRRFAAGQYVPELLFDDAEIAARVKDHPMALWRTQQAPKKPPPRGIEP